MPPRRRRPPSRQKTARARPAKASEISLDTVRPPEDWTLADGITQSILSNYLCCHFRGLLSLNRWGNRDKLKNTRFGSAFHEILDKAYSSGRAPSDKLLSKWLADYMAQTDDYTTKEIEQREEDKALLHAVLRNYFRHYREDFTKKTFKRVEKSWDVAWRGYRLRGKIDGEYLDKRGQIRLMEHKTKGRIDEERLMAHLSFDFQNLFYVTMYETQTGKVVKGTLYNVVRRPQLRRGAGESLKDFANRTAEDVAKRPEHYFKRMDITYSKKDKAMFQDELKAILDELAERLAHPSSRPFFRNRFGCETPFRCAFLGACASGSLNGFTQQKSLFPEL